MAKLAIKGHSTRGNEVIKILEMLGGRNKYHINITECHLLYTIREGDNVIIGTYPNSSISQIYTIEGFLEKFPYKVGDKVSSKYLKNFKIEKMEWKDTNNRVVYKLEGMGWYRADELQPYKAETMEKEISGAIVDRFICLEGYDFYDEKGNIIDTKEIIMKKQQKYPKTYEECCNILNLPHCGLTIDVPLHYSPTIICLTKLLICRDAYWEIAGNWKPNFTNDKEKFIITCYYGKVYTTIATNYNRVLVFPTEEMRAAFYENFKDLIEECKELL